MDMKEYMKKKRLIMIKGFTIALACIMVFIFILINLPLGEYSYMISGFGSLLIVIPFLNYMSKKITKLTLDGIKN